MSRYQRTPRPAGADLLATAAEVFASQLLPALPPELKHMALMVGRALDIAAREFRLEGPQAGDEAGALAAAIRAGEFDTGGRADEVWQVLHQQALAGLRIDNPRAAERPDELC